MVAEQTNLDDFTMIIKVRLYSQLSQQCISYHIHWDVCIYAYKLYCFW